MKTTIGSLMLANAALFFFGAICTRESPSARSTSPTSSTRRLSKLSVALRCCAVR
jgi:hypothetical protein